MVFNSGLAALTPGPSTGDRMSFSVFLAGCLHALIILGVGFALPEMPKSKTPPTMDVVLASHYANKAPDHADFLGQANQNGGGDSKQARAPRTSSQSEMPSPDARATADPIQGGAKPQLASKRTITAKQSDTKVARSETRKDADPLPQTVNTASLVAQSLAIAALTEQMAQEQALQAKAPRKKTISAAIQSALEAPYYDAWRRRVESVGKQYFPSGVTVAYEMIATVTINADGTLREVRITQSSGNPKVDQSAREIFHKAQPFPAFTPAMRKRYDQLEIVRLVRFEPGAGFSTAAQ